jgi:hypothetical protein
MPASKIKKDDAVFLHDGEVQIGAVRQIAPDGKQAFVVFVENHGDMLVPFSAVQDVHFGKVILDSAKIGADLTAAIARAHVAEDPVNKTNPPA